MARELIVRIIGDPSSLNKALAESSASAQGFGGRMKSVGATMTSVGKRMTIAGGIIAGVGIVIGKKLVDAGLEAEKSEARLDRSFQNAGISAIKNAGAVAQAEEAGRKLGFTNENTRDSLQKLIQGGDNVTQSMSDLALAQDYARATGRDLTAATGSIVKVHQGLLRPLKELGISLPQITDHMKALQAAHKAAGTEITANEKRLAFQQDKMATGAAAVQLMTDKLHGQAQAFSETSAGGAEAFRAKMQGIQESLGKLLLPFLDKAIDVLNRVADAFDGLSPGTKKMIVDIGLAVVAFGAVLLVLGPIIAAIGTLIPIIAAIASPVGLVVVALAALVAALVAAVLWPDKLAAVLEKLGLSSEQAKTVVADLQEAVKILAAVFQAVFPPIEAIVKAVVMGIYGELKGLISIIRGVVDVVSGIFHGDWAQVWKGVEEIVHGAITAVMALLNGWKTILSTVGRLLLEALVAGLRAYIHLFIAFWSGLGSLLAQAAAALPGVALRVGVAIVRGIISGLSNLNSLVTAELHKIPGILANIAGQAFGWAVHIGSQIVSGVLSGLGSLAGRVKDKVEGAIGSVLSHINVPGFSPPEEAAKKAIADPIVKGGSSVDALGGTLKSKLEQQLKDALQAVTTARGTYASAFGDLASQALGAFDAKMQTWKPPAQKILDRMQLQDEIKSAAEAIANAQKDLNAARAAAVAEATPENIAAVQTAERALADARRSAREQELARDAAQQTAIHDKEVARDRVHLQDRLDNLQGLLASFAASGGELTAKEMATFRGKMNALLKDFGIDSHFWGTTIGIGLAQGMKDSQAATVAAAEALAAAIARKLKAMLHHKSPPEEGPLSDDDTWFKNLIPTLVSGVDVSAITVLGTQIGSALQTAIGAAGGVASFTDILKGKGDSGIVDIAAGLTADTATLQGVFKGFTDTTTAWADTTAASVQGIATQMTAVSDNAGTVTGVLAKTASDALKLTKGPLEDMRDLWFNLSEAIGRVGNMAYYTRAALNDTVDDIIKRLSQLSSAGGVLSGARAAGGPVTGGKTYLVGERGPELFVPSSTGRIAAIGTASVPTALGGGGLTVEVNVYGDVTGNEIVQKVREGLLSLDRYNPGVLGGRA